MSRVRLTAVGTLRSLVQIPPFPTTRLWLGGSPHYASTHHSCAERSRFRVMIPERADLCDSASDATVFTTSKKGEPVNLTLYSLLKFLHVLLAVVAVGFTASYGIWLARAAREPEHSCLLY